MTRLRRVILLSACLAVAALAAGLGAPGAQAAPVHLIGPASADPAATMVSNNWAGFVAAGGTYTAVTATWIQPAIPASGAPTTQAAFWVGLDGGPNATKTLEQLGTSAEIGNDGKPVYSAWWEMIPKPSVTIQGFAVTPGDLITATVTSHGDGSFTLALEDQTTGQSFSTVQSNGVKTSTTAEIIVERTTELLSGGKQRLSPYAYCGTAEFTGCAIDGRRLSASSPTKWVLFDTHQNALSPVAPIEPDGTSFFVFSPSVRPVTAAAGPQGVWHNTPVDLTFTCTLPTSVQAPPIKFTESLVDDALWTPGTKLTIPAPADHSNDGLHTVQFRTVDEYLNYEVPKIRTVGIDTLGPTAVAEDATASAGGVCTILYSVRDKTSPEVACTLQIEQAGKVLKTWSRDDSAPTPQGQWWKQRFTCDLPRGTYAITVLARDLAGNDQVGQPQATLTVK